MTNQNQIFETLDGGENWTSIAQLPIEGGSYNYPQVGSDRFAGRAISSLSAAPFILEPGSRKNLGGHHATIRWRWGSRRND